MRPDRTGPRLTDRGFTLIELLVVVVILGVLAGITIPIYLNQRDKAAEAAIQSDLRNAANEIEASITDGASYADATLSGLALTEGVTITLTSKDARAYCLDGTSVDTDAVFRYDIAAGGLLAGSCGS